MGESSADGSLKIKPKQLSAVVCGLISTLSCNITCTFKFLVWVKGGSFVFLAGSICSFIIHESVTTQKTTFFPGAGF